MDNHKINIKDYPIKRAKSPVCYYPNCITTYNAILECGDIEKNPGPGFGRPSCKKHNAPLKNLQTKKLRLLNFQSVIKVLVTNACYNRNLI